MPGWTSATLLGPAGIGGTLLARRDSATALLETFPEYGSDLAAAQTLMENLDAKREAVARAVGAVAVEGPDAVAHSAELAAYAIEHLAGRLRDWSLPSSAVRTARSWSGAR